MISSIVSRLVILLFGTLYPAYASYKAVRTKDVKEYVKWMMYWIVFALFTCAETFTDVFIGFWFPFYYEIKIILVIWLLSPATKGSSILYRKFVHPTLKKREQEIDEAIMNAKQQGYHTILSLGSKGVNYATAVIMQTAIKGGGGLVNQLRKSYSLTDLTDRCEDPRGRPVLLASLKEEQDAVDVALADPWHLRCSMLHGDNRSESGSNAMEMYFSEVDVRHRGKVNVPTPSSFIRSSEDISSGYSSADPLCTSMSSASTPTGDCSIEDTLLRTSSVGSSKHQRPRKSPRIGSSNLVLTKRGSEGSAPLADLEEFEGRLDDLRYPHPLLSQFLIAQLTKQLSLEGGDLNNFFSTLSSQLENKNLPTPSSEPQHIEEKDSVATIPVLSEDCNVKEDSKIPKGELWLSESEVEVKEISPSEDDQDESDLDFKEANSSFESTAVSSYHSSTPSEFEDAMDHATEVPKSDSNTGTRAGRYGKLRAPSPPGKQSSETESMSDSESGTVVNARMSFVSSKSSIESVNILVESDVGNHASTLKEEKSSSEVKLRKKTEQRDSRLRNSFGSLTSLFPFWQHHSSENLRSTSQAQVQNSSVTSIPTELESSIAMTCGNSSRNAEKNILPATEAQGLGRDTKQLTSDVRASRLHSSNDEDKFLIREMSHSPTRRTLI